MNKELLKLWRFASIYGISRTLNKAFGRLRKSYIKAIYSPFKSPSKNVILIGCGHFAFSCVCFFLKKNKGNVFKGCYDISPQNSKSIANYYSIPLIFDKPEQLLSQIKKDDIVYIASNHFTHTFYSIEAMKRGAIVYVEKPISVTQSQLIDLVGAARKYNSKVFAGYNRPYSKAINTLKEKVKAQDLHKDGRFSLNFFISGHFLDANHWYRIPNEGTRICGNVGHWIDLTIHILSWRSLPQQIDINISYSDTKEFDDNISITLVTNFNDIVTIFLTSRTEPFEGINETINFQYNDIIAKIDDFRKLTIWNKENLSEFKYFPKDVGHQRSILQPYHQKTENRDWQEVEISTILMLKITAMVRKTEKNAVFSLFDEMESFEKLVEQKIINETNYTKS
jgi:predicted dehydrogenase